MKLSVVNVFSVCAEEWTAAREAPLGPFLQPSRLLVSTLRLETQRKAEGTLLGLLPSAPAPVY